MQTLTFTQKLLRQRRFLNALIPLLAIFIGLGAQTAKAGAILANSTVFISSNGGANQTFNANPSTPNPFMRAALGSYDINTGQLVLNGGSITANLNGGTTASAGFLDFVVLDNLGNNVNSGIITLTPGTATTSSRTFTTPSANIDLLRGIIVADTSFVVNVSYRVLTRTNGSNGTARDENGGGGYEAKFNVTGVLIAPTNIGNSNVFINTTGATTPNITYGAGSGVTPLFQGANLGSFDINTGKLTLNGGNATTFESGGDAIQSARLSYLIVKPAQNSQPGRAFPQSFIALSQNGAPTVGNGGTTRSYSNSTELRNLISGLANSGIGNFTISVSFEAVVLRANGTTFIAHDDNGGNGYTASFTTTGVPIMINTWTGGVSDDWFTPTNWDLNLVPTANMNVVIPDFGSGSAKAYPNINSDVIYTAVPGGQRDNRNSGPALCRDLIMQGATQAQRSILRLIVGRLRVFGSFDNSFVSWAQRSGTVCEFAGSGNQTITGGAFTAVELSGGGTKNLTTIMTVSTSMTFLSQGGLLTTDISNPDGNYVDLAGRSTNAPDGAQLLGESDAGAIPAYLRGFVQTTRSDVRANEVDASNNPAPRTFGNMGMTIFFKGANNPGDVLVTRNTAESYTPLVPSSVPPGTPTSRFGIRRIFGVRPGSPNTNSGGLLADLTFRYLDSELNQLGPGGTGSVPEPNLALFVSTTGGDQFGFLGSDALDQTSNILTKNDVRTFATFTLGDRNNPLPVSMTGFDAKRAGTDALLTWGTATEKDSRGYDVQVSTDGKEFRTLGFVASKSPNSIMPQSYSFVDVEKSKVGVRYYRLRQVDLDGKETFFGPRTVSFDGKATEGAVMTVYPNPFNSADQLHLNLQSARDGVASLTIVDMTGRIVRQQKVGIVTGSNDVTVDRLNDLKAGLYQVRFVLPSGEVRSLKVMKQ